MGINLPSAVVQPFGGKPRAPWPKEEKRFVGETNAISPNVGDGECDKRNPIEAGNSGVLGIILGCAFGTRGKVNALSVDLIS